MHIALKCTFNDGGRIKPNGVLGFAGTCSNENMLRNVQNRVWCSQPQSQCRQFVDGDFTGPRPKSPCYESTIFTDWKFGTGVYHNGNRAGELDKPKHVNKGDFALLTTRLPDGDEGSRKIIGIMLLKEPKESKDNFWLLGDPLHSLRAPETALLSYWQFRKGTQRWGSHLYRYIKDNEVTNYLRALLPMLKKPEDYHVAERLISLSRVRIHL